MSYLWANPREWDWGGCTGKEEREKVMRRWKRVGMSPLVPSQQLSHKSDTTNAGAIVVEHYPSKCDCYRTCILLVGYGDSSVRSLDIYCGVVLLIGSLLGHHSLVLTRLVNLSRSTPFPLPFARTPPGHKHSQSLYISINAI